MDPPSPLLSYSVFFLGGPLRVSGQKSRLRDGLPERCPLVLKKVEWRRLLELRKINLIQKASEHWRVVFACRATPPYIWEYKMAAGNHSFRFLLRSLRFEPEKKKFLFRVTLSPLAMILWAAVFTASRSLLHTSEQPNLSALLCRGSSLGKPGSKRVNFSWLWKTFSRFLASLDGHDHCLTCLGREHAEAAFTDGSCVHCERMTMATLNRLSSFRQVFSATAARHLGDIQEIEMSAAASEGESEGEADGSAGWRPSGVAAPSEADAELSAMLLRAAKDIGLEVPKMPPADPSRLDDWFLGRAPVAPPRSPPSAFLPGGARGAARGHVVVPQVERAVAVHLCPWGAATWRDRPHLPSRACKLSSALAGRAYHAAGQAATALHAMATLQVYQAQALKHLHEGGPDQGVMQELRAATDFALRATKVTARSLGQVMSTVVVQERHLWLTLAQMADIDNLAFSTLPSPRVAYSATPSRTLPSGSEADGGDKTHPAPPLKSSWLRESSGQPRGGGDCSLGDDNTYVPTPGGGLGAAVYSNAAVGLRVDGTHILTERVNFITSGVPAPSSLFERCFAFSDLDSEPDIASAGTREDGCPTAVTSVKVPLISLATRLGAWLQLPSSSQWLIRTVRLGYAIQFARRPPRYTGVLSTSVHSDTHAAVLCAEVAVLLAKDTIKPVPPAEMKSGFYSPYFIVPKKSGGLRPILDLRALNRSLLRLPFKMLTTKRMLTYTVSAEVSGIIQTQDSGPSQNISSRGEDPQRCPIAVVLSFLQEKLERRLSPSTLKVYVAAIAAYHDAVDGTSLGKHQLIGLREAPFEPLASGELKHLSLKTALLTALASIKRVGDLQAFSVDETCLEFGPGDSHVTLRPRPGYVPKVPTTPFRDQVLNLQALPLEEADPASVLLCPVRVLRIYVDHTRHFRRTEQLFVCFGGQQKGNAVSKQRLAYWVVDAISLSYQNQGEPCPLGVRAHSTQSVASSYALAHGTSLADICRAAGWATPNTFARFYNLRVEAVSSRVGLLRHSYGIRVLYPSVVPPGEPWVLHAPQSGLAAE
ncbi:hypothetical protein M9458_052405 [Cirrhinus mrigala]|uniref:Uncharacterized protein n=1 Tax=Cirrhinus mrigala TaxID=683832 RepID=A0ABD0MV58_CIRMR